MAKIPLSNQVLGIVIVSYNSADEIVKCINSAREAAKAAGVKSYIVVVDNNSKDSSVAKSKKSATKVIPNSKNVGFSKAVNQGIKESLEAGCDYILILNPDLILSSTSLSPMLQALKATDQIGAVGPSMVNHSGEAANDGYYQKAPSWISVSLFSTFLRPYAVKHLALVNKFLNETGLEQNAEVEQIPGACLLTSRNVLRKVGYLDEDFAIWFEDVEWCYRARKAGYKMWFCADAPVEHEGGTSFEKWQSLDKAVTFYVSMKTFFDKHKPVSGALVRLAISINSIFLFIKNRDRSNLVFLRKFWAQKTGVLPD